jgi:integrase
LAKSGAVVAAALPKTLSKLLEEFFTHHVDEKLAPKTVERYHQQAAYIHQDLLAMPIAEITPLHLNREWTRLSKCGGHTRKGVPRPMSPKTVRNIAGVVSSAFARAIRWGLVSANPVTNSEPPRVKKHLAIALTPAQQNMLVSAASGPWCMKAYLELDTATGCRRGELLALRWCDVAAGVAHISRSLTQTRGGVLQFKDTKTEKPRVVVLPQSAVAALETHRKQQDEFRRQFGSDYRTDLDLVFANPDGTPLKPDSISATVSALFKRLKIPKPKGAALHLLRHTHTSVLLSEGVPLAAVSARLGHSSVRTTQEIYAHMITGQDEEAAQKWEEYQKRNRPPTTKDWKGQVQ